MAVIVGLTRGGKSKIIGAWPVASGKFFDLRLDRVDLLEITWNY